MLLRITRLTRPVPHILDGSPVAVLTSTYRLLEPNPRTQEHSIMTTSTVGRSDEMSGLRSQLQPARQRRVRARLQAARGAVKAAGDRDALRAVR